MDQLTLLALFTAAGAGAAAIVIRQFIELLKASWPTLDDKVSGARLAFILSAALYGAGWAVVGPATAEGVFAAFLAWLTCGLAAVGINATWDHVRGN